MNTLNSSVYDFNAVAKRFESFLDEVERELQRNPAMQLSRCECGHPDCGLQQARVAMLIVMLSIIETSLKRLPPGVVHTVRQAAKQVVDAAEPKETGASA